MIKKITLILVLVTFLVACGTSARPIQTDINEITLEAGTTFDPTSYFTINDEKGNDVTDQMTYTGTLNTAALGTYDIKLEIKVDGVLYRHPLTVHVVDTTPPTIKLVSPHFFYIKGTTRNAIEAIISVSDNLDQNLTADQVTIDEQFIGVSNILSESVPTYDLTFSISDQAGNLAKESLKGFEVMPVRYMSNSVYAVENFVKPIYDHAYNSGFQINIFGSFDYQLVVVNTVDEAKAVIDQHTGSKSIAVYTDYPDSVNGIALFIGR